jgi:hypothetical protein
MPRIPQFAYKNPWWTGIGVGVLGSLLLYVAITLMGWVVLHPSGLQRPHDLGLLLLSVSYLVVTPLVTGFASVSTYLQMESPERVRTSRCFTIPAMTLLLQALILLAIKWEGIICVVMIAPIVLVVSLIGAAIALVLAKRRRISSSTTLPVLVLPLLLVLVEAQIPSPFEIRTVNTEILIHAPVQTVWANIASVPRIAPEELPGSWVQKIGFPLPVEATLSHPGVGGIRQATFTGNLTFTETVNQWELNKDLRFSIRANTESIPPTTLDEHLVIGGRFFDVLDGEYSLEPRPDGVMLHLTSRERLSTHVNPYAGVWTDAVMRAIQRQILVVIRNRCEIPNTTMAAPSLR